MPGTPKQKDALLNCVSCHTLDRIVRSTHNAEEFMQGAGAHGELRQPERTDAPAEAAGRAPARGARRFTRRRRSRTAPNSWPRINLSESDDMDISRSKPMPRPTGAATKVIITEYDLPRDSIEPHDVIVGKDGNGLVYEFRRAEPRPARSQDRQGDGDPSCRS